MKTHVRHIGLTSLLAGLAALVTGCCTVDTTDWEQNDFEVVLKPNGDVLEIVSDPQGWEAGQTGPVKKKGYVGFAPKTKGSITLVMEGYDASKGRCTADRQSSAEWVITQVMLSKSGNKDTQKGKKFGNKQPGWLTKAFTQANDNGIVFDEGKDSGVASFTVTNNNNNYFGGKWAYYQVTATNCSTGGTATTDPAFQNGGKGNN